MGCNNYYIFENCDGADARIQVGREQQGSNVVYSIIRPNYVEINNVPNGKTTRISTDGLEVSVGSNYSHVYSSGITCGNNSGKSAMAYNGIFVNKCSLDEIFDNTSFVNLATMQVIDAYYLYNNCKIQGPCTATSFNPPSKEEVKKDFEKLDNGLEIIKNIDIYKYRYKEENDTKKHIGLVIGDDYKYSEEVTNNDNDGVDLYSFISVCCKAIQEQQKEIEELKEEISKLKEGRQ